MQQIYMDTVDGIMELELPYWDVDDVKAVYQEWAEPWTIYELVLKKKTPSSWTRYSSTPRIASSSTSRIGRNGHSGSRTT